MGTLSAFIPLLGIPVGYYLATLVPSEIRHGKRVFRYFSSAIFALISAIVFWNIPFIAFSLSIITFFILLFIPKPELASIFFLASTLQHTVIPLYLGSILMGSLYGKRALVQPFFLGFVFTICSTIMI